MLKSRSITPAIFLPVFLIVSSGCSSTPVHWKKESWAKQSSDDAHAACSKRARFATGTTAISTDDAVTPQWSDYMKECMSTYGYTLVRGHDPAAETKDDNSRGTASVAPAPNS